MMTRLHSQEGASAVIVALCLVLLFGAGAIAVDLGSAWDTKRDLVVDTDAAALAAARVGADEGCTTTAETAAIDFLSDNLGQTVTATDINYQCTTETNTTTPNTVSVEFTDQAQQALSSALGVDDLDVFAASTAEFNGGAFGPLRPITVCHTDLPASLTPPSSPSTPETVIVGMSRTWKNPDCGGGTGTWGWLCFDVTSGCSTNDIQDFLADGFPRTVDLGTALGGGQPHPYDHPNSDEDCDEGTIDDQWCAARTGSEQNPDQLDTLVDDGTTFSIVISDCIGELNGNACDPASGSNTEVHPYAFAYVRLDAWCERKINNSSDWYPASAPYTEAECENADTGNNVPVLALTVLGTISTGVPQDFFNPVDARVELCGVDHDPGSEDNRCDRAFRD